MCECYVSSTDTLQEVHSLLTSPGIVLQWMSMGILFKFGQNFLSKERLENGAMDNP